MNEFVAKQKSGSDALNFLHKNSNKFGLYLCGMGKPKRPRDFVQRTKMIVDIATGAIEDNNPDKD